MNTSQYPLFSVIVPVYNVAGFLGQCVNSVLSQGFRDFELILVDDGSRDGCPAMCDGYAAHDGRVRVIHKPNGGLSSARNAGMDIACGQYLLFIDGDDSIEADAFDTLAQTLRRDGDTDVIMLNMFRCYEDGRTKPFLSPVDRERFYARTREEALEHIKRLPVFPAPACCKLVSRRLADENGLRFNTALYTNEDVDFSIRLFLHAESFNYSDYLYFYRQGRAGALTSAITEREYADARDTILGWIELAKGKYQARSGFILHILAYQYCVLLYKLACLPPKARARLKREVRELRWLLDCSDDVRVKVVRLGCRLFGMGGAAALLKKYYSIKS